ncbi:uncharacterized protein [Gossypium hirsutum]|uniref:Uncharacterized protein n=1 Tax=Gossypium hirsutum TaxID=3635 RepID=A0ABM3AM69_GOSHI|nr:uncharacterized protein LOC121220275 [Gossypium hirsutum]
MPKRHHQWNLLILLVKKRINSLTTLKNLYIRGCLHLEKWCNEGGGEGWPYIAHVPCIEITAYDKAWYSKRRRSHRSNFTRRALGSKRTENQKIGGSFKSHMGWAIPHGMDTWLCEPHGLPHGPVPNRVNFANCTPNTWKNAIFWIFEHSKTYIYQI